LRKNRRKQLLNEKGEIEMMKRQTKSTVAVVRKGFTLTELLIVMAILVLLVSLVGPRLLGSKAKADVNSVKTQIGMFQSSLERYAIDMNRFPSSEQGLAALVAVPSADSGEGDSGGGEDVELEGDNEDSAGSGSNWDGPYIKTETLPKDPWGNSYRYEYPATHNKINVPDIWSFGPDGQENTDDDVVSWTGDGTSGDGEDMGDESNAS
jgi:general secretion pathway protein G